MSLFITTVLTSPHAEFDACYRLMQATFPVDELVDRAEYAHLLKTPQMMQHPHWFAMLARWEQTTSQLVGMVAGSYMTLESDCSSGIGMIEYLAVAPDQHHQGHGRALLSAFEDLMHHYARQRNETLKWLVGEVEDELLPFKFHLGYHLPECLRYVQPPIEFDRDGHPCYAPVPKHLVLKSMDQMNPPDTITPDTLRAIIQTIYRWRYVPLLGDEAARQEAAQLIQRDIYAQVSASLNDDVIVLRATMQEAK